MASQLKNILTFVIPAGGVVVIPHLLNWTGLPVTPDLIAPEEATGTTFTADDVNVTATNPGPQGVNVRVLVESWHTIERSFGDVANTKLVPQPFVLNGGGGGGLIPDTPLTTIVFRPGDPLGSRQNVYVTWAETYAALQVVKGLGIVYLQFDDSFAPTSIPAGVWNMTDVVWTNAPKIAATFGYTTIVILEDGVSIVLDFPVFELRILGYGLQIRCERLGLVAPFFGVDLILDGEGVQLFNAPGTLPMFVSAGIDTITIMGCCLQGLIGEFGQLPGQLSVPVIDVAGGGVGIFGGAGLVFNGAVTDSVGFGFLGFRIFDDSFMGGGGNGTTMEFPLLDAAGGFVAADQCDHRDRHFIATGQTAHLITGSGDPGDTFSVAAGIVTVTIVPNPGPFGPFTDDMIGLPVTITNALSGGNNGTYTILTVSALGDQITYANPGGVNEAIVTGPPATSFDIPFRIFYNEFIRVDTSIGDGVITIGAPRATAVGERITVKDLTGNASVNNIRVASVGVVTDVIQGEILPGDGALITGDGQCYEWISDGLGTPTLPGTWMLKFPT